MRRGSEHENQSEPIQREQTEISWNVWRRSRELVHGGAATEAFTQGRRLTTIGGVASTRSGRVRGLVKDGVHQFWPVQYGAPSGGTNRFMPAQQPEAWSGVRDHFEIGYAAPIEPGQSSRQPSSLL